MPIFKSSRDRSLLRRESRTRWTVDEIPIFNTVVEDILVVVDEVWWDIGWDVVKGRFRADDELIIHGVDRPSNRKNVPRKSTMVKVTMLESLLDCIFWDVRRENEIEIDAYWNDHRSCNFE
jgi:hypothetical protein